MRIRPLNFYFLMAEKSSITMNVLKANENVASLFFILYNCKILYNNEAVEN